MQTFSRDVLTRTVHVRVSKTSDIEIHVSQIDTAWGQYTDIREYVVSLEQYGRGVTFPSNLAEPVMAGLEFFLGAPDGE